MEDLTSQIDMKSRVFSERLAQREELEALKNTLGDLESDLSSQEVVGILRAVDSVEILSTIVGSASEAEVMLISVMETEVITTNIGDNIYRVIKHKVDAIAPISHVYSFLAEIEQSPIPTMNTERISLVRGSPEWTVKLDITTLSQ